MDTERNLLELALRKAFDFGQEYWYYAYSDSPAENDKSDATRQKFEALITETLAAIDHHLKGKPDAVPVYLAAPPKVEGATPTEPVEGTSMPPWTLSSPDGRVWTGDSPLRAAAAAQRDTIDPVLAMQRINAAVAEEQALHDTEMAAEFERGRQLGMQQEPALWKEGQNGRKTLAEAAHKARRAACGEWSNIMAGPQAVLPEDFDARCDKAQAAEQLLADAIDRLASLPPPAAAVPSPCQYAIDHGGNLYRRYAAPVCAGCVPAAKETDKWDSARVADYNAGWNACRESMLAASPPKGESTTQAKPMSEDEASRLDAAFARMREKRDSLKQRLFEALESDPILKEGLEEVDHALHINRMTYSRVLDVACAQKARADEAEAKLAALSTTTTATPQEPAR